MTIKKLLIILVLALALLGLTYVVVPRQQPFFRPGSPALSPRFVVAGNYVKYPGQDGKNALQLLQALTDIQVREYSFGTMVVGIHGAVPDSKHFWELYINGRAASVGARQLQTHKGDIIEWKLSEIKSGE